MALALGGAAGAGAAGINWGGVASRTGGLFQALGAARGPSNTLAYKPYGSTSTPYQQEEYRKLLDRAEALYGQEFGQEFLDALDQERYRLSQGQSLTDQAIGMLQNMVGQGSALERTASGAFLDPNSEQYRNMYDMQTRGLRENFANEIIPQINNQAMSAGRWGSAAQQREANKAGEVLTQQLSDVATRMADAERQRQMQAIGQRAQLGGQLAGYQGNTVNRLSEIDPYNVQKARLGDYKDFVSGSYGNTQSGYSTEAGSKENKFSRLGAALGNIGKIF